MKRSQPLGDPEPALGLGEEHDATVRRQAPTVESGGDLLAGTAGNGNVGVVSSVMAGVAPSTVAGLVSATKSYAASSA